MRPEVAKVALVVRVKRASLFHKDVNDIVKKHYKIDTWNGLTQPLGIHLGQYEGLMNTGLLLSGPIFLDGNNYRRKILKYLYIFAYNIYTHLSKTQ
jgi:hypothetical protein